MEINGRKIGHAQPAWICAEIGISHNGSFETAQKLIDVAVDAGCDAVKFQKRTIDIVYTQEELSKPRESVFGDTNEDLKRGLEFSFDDYVAIDAYCHHKGILWFASPWDIKSVEFLKGFRIPLYKVASPCLTDEKLLDAICSTDKPILMSIGMSSLKEVSSACKIIEKWGNPYVLLVCTSSYPCKLEDLNLKRIKTLINQGHPVGYSGHEVGLWTTLCAVAMGACVVERHITLDRAMWGSDQAASIEPPGLKKLVKEIRDFEKALGDGKIGMIEAERPVMEKLRRFR